MDPTLAPPTGCVGRLGVQFLSFRRRPLFSRESGLLSPIAAVSREGCVCGRSVGIDFGGLASLLDPSRGPCSAYLPHSLSPGSREWPLRRVLVFAAQGREQESYGLQGRLERFGTCFSRRKFLLCVNAMERTQNEKTVKERNPKHYGEKQEKRSFMSGRGGASLFPRLLLSRTERT